jgi:hypothetical protein
VAEFFSGRRLSDACHFFFQCDDFRRTVKFGPLSTFPKKVIENFSIPALMATD